MRNLYISICALLLPAALLEGWLKADYLKMNAGRPVVRYQDVLLDLLGEGRTVLARYLWFKMDTMHEQLDDQGNATFKQKEVIPLLRMINYLDPYLTEAYDTLAAELEMGYQQPKKAMELVEEGLQYSPNSFTLNFRKAYLAERQRDSLTAYEFARKALEADQIEEHNLNALRIMYRACLRLRDAKTGIVVVEAISRLSGGANPYAEQYAQWRRQVDRP